jgi:hypothetical protein
MLGTSLKRLAPVLAIALTVVPGRAASDGIVMKPHEDGWRPATESLQEALITYRDGIERLTVAITVDDADAKSMVWLLPVPAAPKQVHVDVLGSFPRLRGTEVYGGAMESSGNLRTVAVVMQVWPPAAYMLLEFLGAYGNREMPKAAAAAPMAAEGSVLVHERVEKQGMVSEVITAKEGAALYAYLAGKGLNLKAGAIPTLDFYIGKDYTFIASWFSRDTTQKQDSASTIAKAIEVRFPAEEMFFPLFPTSAYGERVVPASIRVAGHVTPRPFADIAQRTSIGYYVSTIRGEDGPGSLGTDLYTKIDIDAPAKAFTQDLWISPKPPRLRGLDMATFVVRHDVIVSIALLVAVSALTSLVVGWPVFKELRTGKGALRLMLAGLGNCLTLLGMLVTIVALPKGWKRRAGYLAAFSLLFMLGTAVVTWSMDAFLEPMKPNSYEFRSPGPGQ